MLHNPSAPSEEIPQAVMDAARALLAATQATPQTVVSEGERHVLLTVKEAAAMLRVSRMTVVRAIKSGEFPSVQFRRTYKVPRVFIDRLIGEAASGKQVVVEDYAARWSAGASL